MNRNKRIIDGANRIARVGSLLNNKGLAMLSVDLGDSRRNPRIRVHGKHTKYLNGGLLRTDYSLGRRRTVMATVINGVQVEWEATA